MCSCNRGARKAPEGGGGPVARTAMRPAARSAAAPAAAPVAAAAAAVEPPQPIPTVDTSIWGPPLWRILHIASVLTKSKQHIPFWRTLLVALKTGLPCPDCSAHYNAWVGGQALRFSMYKNGIRNPIVQWILDLHNNVNQRQDPPVPTWSIDQVLQTYQLPASEAIAILPTLKGVIGDGAHAAILALLNSLR